jgi:hypothetical protein
VALPAAEPPPVLFRQGVDLAVVDGQDLPVLDGHRDVVANQFRQHQVIATAGRDDLRARVGDPVHQLVEQGHQDRLLAAEVPVDPGADDAGLGPDVGHRDRMETAPGAEGGRGGQDPLFAVRVADPRPGRLFWCHLASLAACR